MGTVLVTGATDGLGRALASRLAGEGASVLALVVGDLASLSLVGV
jgi:NAD(P)-dependent dehydrogenase (short-subunit alcohol dehydrogenase family)